MDKFTLAVIGGGASGLMAAALACKHNINTVIIEASDRVGKKLLATGNGRCNLSNKDISAQYYNSTFVNTVLAKYPIEHVINEFRNLGLLTCAKDGRIYPYSMMASSVIDCLRDNIGAAHVINAAAEAITPTAGGYAIAVQDGIILADKVCLASGSNASFGRNSLKLYGDLSHAITTLTPSLCPIQCDANAIRGLNGVRHQVILTLNIGDNAYTQSGEILFKQSALSGIAIFNLSAHLARSKVSKATISIDFLPEFDDVTVANLAREGNLKYMLHKNIYALLGEDKTVAKRYKIQVAPNSDVSQAQVICGGLDTHYFDPATLESVKHSGLYAIGEALDVDGQCGGYNLHWAWTSAMACIDSITNRRSN